MLAEFHETFQLFKHFFQSVGGYDNIVNERENAFAARPFFKSFLELSLAEVGCIHQPKGDTFVAVNLRWG